MVKFSIIVVCLNAGNGLKRTIDSILSQTCEDYEIIVKDGMSGDGSVEALPESERMQIYRKEDQGIYDAMNQAVEKVQGEYVYFLNSGDVFHDKDVLARVKQQMDRKEAEDALVKEEAEYIFYGDIYEQLTGEPVASNPSMDAFGCYRNVPCHQACFYDAGLMRRKQFDIRYRVRADYEHFLWCFFKGEAKTVYLPVTIADYEGGGFSETKANRKRSADEHKEITGKYMAKKQILKYRMLMLLTLSGVRTRLARNRMTAAVYNRIKRRLYSR